MSQWRHWWNWWIATAAPTRRPALPEAQADVTSDEVSAVQAASLLRHPAATHPANTSRLQVATQRLQRDLGNRGVQLLSEDRGEPLPAHLRQAVGGTVGDDLNDVQIHRGAAGDELARLAGAEAVTIGRDIAFAAGAYAPETVAGQQLLAHEMAHTVQTGSQSEGDRSRLEQQARIGKPVPGTAGVGQVLRQEKKSWSERVAAAQAETDVKAKRTLLIALVQEALGSGYQLNIVAESPTSGAVDPAHYQPAPMINFDFNLENKEYWSGAGRTGKLGPRSGYFFSSGNKGYAILGPGAIEASTPALTRMAADHELFHTSHHMGAGQSSQQELEAWVDAFVHYFHQVYQARKSWLPMIDYYESADSGARKTALDTLFDYFQKQPANIQKAMLNWLARRQKDAASKQLVIDLTAKLPATVAPNKPGK